MSDPWLKFYPTDWRSDPRLRMCSPAARGVWIDLICIMHEATPYGHLLVERQTPNEAQLASLTGTQIAELSDIVAELERFGVFSRTKEGVIYSRKLVRMAAKSAKARKNGKGGGNPILGNKKEKSCSDNLTDKGQLKPQKPEARSQSILEPTDVGSLSSGDDVADAVADYNAAAEASGWPRVHILSKSRRAALKARLSECGGREGWRVALTRAMASPLCNGSNDRGWTANFDFMTRQSSFAKLMEGNYDQRTGTSFGGTNAGGRKVAVSAGSRFSSRENPF